MARVMYLDCFSGVAGDMLLGALIDVGVPVDALREALGSLAVGHELRVSRVMRAGIAATQVTVLDASGGPGSHSPERRVQPHVHEHVHDHGHTHVHEHGGHHHEDDGGGHAHRSVKEIAHLIGHSTLSAAGKARAVALFGRLAEAEAAIHNMSVEQVHLHEVGSVDSIIDICGVVFAMEWLGIDDIVASPLNVGGGSVDIAHGRYPVPAPATVRLLAGVPVYSRDPQVELVTPTGALLVSGYAKSYGPTPAMSIDRAGYGAGTRDFPRVPNVVRVVVGDRAEAGAAPAADEAILQIECEIDDMNPQLFGPATERLFEAGALDVFLTPVQMKKGRPGTLLTVLTPEDWRAAVTNVLFRETTTIGVRFQRVWRETLDRRIEEVVIGGGVVRIKVSGRQGETLNAAPEFDDCLRIATATGRPVKDIHAEALRAFLA